MSEDASPMWRQYLEIKKRYPDTLVLFRLGDFYETFNEDAEIVARELDVVLTGRSIAKDVRVPMAGVPHHAVEGYVARLIAKGYHVAMCDQMSDEPIKGLMPREVTRVITPGTVVEPGMLSDKRNNYLAAILAEAEQVGLAYADITTGEFAATEITGPDALAHAVRELARLQPAELLIEDRLAGPGKRGARSRPINGATAESPAADGSGPGDESARLFGSLPYAKTPLPSWRFEQATARQALLTHFEVSTLAGFGAEDWPLAVRAAGAIVQYLGQTATAALGQITGLRTYSLSSFMSLDPATRRGLELTESIRGRTTPGSLLGILDETVTPMGGRLLRRWMSQPLLDMQVLHLRLDRVQALTEASLLRAEVRARLKKMSDLERLTNRVLGRSAGPRDVAAMRETLELVRELAGAVSASSASSSYSHGLVELASDSHLDPCEEVVGMIGCAISDEPPASLDKIGVIRSGYSAELDGVIEASRGAKDWVANLEPAERERTGIRSLKVAFNKVFGYYIEVSNANRSLIPADYIRKQTLVNAERYITPELKEYEALILHADERIQEIEGRLFRELCAGIAREADRLLETARTLAEFDVLAALAEVAVRRNYVRPVLTEDDVLDIRNGRHPVVETALRDERFVPNDVRFTEDERIQIITGPNMAGKSTFLRQTALIALMAQIGSFVPADSATIGLIDRIFTRIGAQDEIAAGQSTFMVEMVETAYLLTQATRRSLLILDEVGRGTSTYDGLAIAQAVVEYLHNNPKLRAKTLFATHYHELVKLADSLPHVRNYNVAVAEDQGQVFFLHKIIPGGADKSYGIHVAEIAGIPKAVSRRANEILADLEKQRVPEKVFQRTMFSTEHPVVATLRVLNPDEMSPIEALTRLYELKRLVS